MFSPGDGRSAEVNNTHHTSVGTLQHSQIVMILVLMYDYMFMHSRHESFKAAVRMT